MIPQSNIKDVEHKIPVDLDKLQITVSQKEELEKQQYRIVGHHSAVKICGWAKNHLKGQGVCYKYSFYGIRSHQCLQMTTSLFCASRCIFCWRGAKAPVSKKWYGPIDSPIEIIDHAIDEQKALLHGFRGNDKANKKLVVEMDDVRHVALSLTGEPITYPKINELIKEFHRRRISTFLVSNSQYPEEIKNLEPVSQLYLSLDAPSDELFKKVDRPLFSDYSSRVSRSLDVLRKIPYRTTIRLTLIKDVNMTNLEGYSNLIMKGSPDFIELKAYMYVGESRENLGLKNMPLSEDVAKFGSDILKHLPDYEFISEHKASRVVLLGKKSLSKKSFIDFDKFFSIVNSGGIPRTEEYSTSKMCDNK